MPCNAHAGHVVRACLCPLDTLIVKKSVIVGASLLRISLGAKQPDEAIQSG